ncbi:MAG: 3-oxoacyl-ACP synthase [Legionella sp. 21-45-4]|nr:MAG: 3-oxoacyl-ACP synthase [Legionella sp. 21-45-4]
MGALYASGLTVDAMWDALLSGQSSLGELSAADLSSWEYRFGGELTQYQPAVHLPDKKLMKVISRHDAMGIHAVVQAVSDSGLIDYQATLSAREAEVFNQDTAVYVGSPGNKYYQQYDFLSLLAASGDDMSVFAERLFSEVHPMWLLRILPNNVLAYTGITYGFKGENHNIVNHVAGGLQAILEAVHAIQSGAAQRAVVVAYDTGIEPQALFYYQQLGVLSAKHLSPFDIKHDGTLLAEGAAALVLESEASARARGRFPYAEVLGVLTKSEGQGLFSVDESGQPLAHLLQQTLTTHQIEPEKLGFIVAHGNGNPKSDISEARALDILLEGQAIPVTAFKWAMGHTLCAAGVIDTVLATRALQAKRVPGVASLKALSPACAHLNLSNQSKALDLGEHALIISRGFAGINASLLLKASDALNV